MALRIPKNATKFRQMHLPKTKHMKVNPNIACPDDDTEVRGAYFVPMINKDKGWFYVVMVGGDDKHEYISVRVMQEERMCSLAELAYIRNLFFENEDKVFQPIPSDYQRVMSLGTATVLWSLRSTPDNPLPTQEEIGNKPNPRIILLNT